MIRILAFLAVGACTSSAVLDNEASEPAALVSVEDQWIVGWVGGKEFFLSEVPVSDSLQLTVEQWDTVYQFQQEWDYSFDSRRNSIYFWDFIPEEGSVVMVAYLPAN